MRINKLVRADIQLKLTFYFALLTVFALVFQFLLLMSAMSAMPAVGGGAAKQNEFFMDAATQTLWLSLAIVLPLTTIVGVLATFRIAGPLHRFSVFLRDIKNGKRPADCRLRKGDELQDFCALLNEATAPIRHGANADAEHSRIAA